MNLVTSSAITMSSREIAELVGKRHDNVKRVIESLHESSIVHPQSEDEWSTDGMGRPRATRIYRLAKRDSFVVVAQLSPEFTARLVDRWQELESAAQEVKPLTHLETARLLVSSLEQIERQAQQLAIAAPKVEFVDKYVEATGLKGFREVCKLLKAGERKFADFLTGEKIMYRLAGNLTPYANHIDAGRFEVKTGSGENGHAFNTSKFTPKGVAYVAGLWNKSGESK